jgi:hypothetical protein
MLSKQENKNSHKKTKNKLKYRGILTCFSGLAANNGVGSWGWRSTAVVGRGTALVASRDAGQVGGWPLRGAPILTTRFYLVPCVAAFGVQGIIKMQCCGFGMFIPDPNPTFLIPQMKTCTISTSKTEFSSGSSRPN